MVVGDMLPPQGNNGETYDAPRGTCPQCGSPDVVHLVIGMPAAPSEWGSGPHWVEWVGCIHPGYTRRCTACEQVWTEDPELGPTFVDLASLITHADAASLQDLGDWVSQSCELDAWALVDDGVLVIGFLTSGTGIEFPLSIDDFWETVDELHDQVELELESGDDE